MRIEQFPRLALGHWPTPLEAMPRLQSVFAGPRLFIKRDDCTGLASGGNKTRKLEFLVADALKCGCDVLLTHGAVQSNHVRQTAAAAAVAGLGCEALLEERLSNDSDEYADSGNVLLDRVLGAVLHRVPGGTAMDAALQTLAADLERRGRRPYVIPGGGSNPLGALGYVECVRELVQQCDRQGLAKPHLVTATGSAGTHAGLAAGIRALGLDWRLTGIGVRLPRAEQEAKVHDLAQRVLRLLEVPQALPREAIVADDRFIGGGYGVPTESMLEAVKLVAQREGILLDPVYTGKAMAGMIAMLRERRFEADEDVVFIHTGGSAALFGYRWAFPADAAPGAPTGRADAPR
jgi:L-cysteate sulfo-lyase